MKRPPAASSAGGPPLLDDPPLVEHDGAVGDADRREPLRRNEHGAARHGRAQVLDEEPLGLRVDGRHRVVEHEHARAREERARERDALALAAGEVDAALADQSVVALRQVVDEGRDAGRVARGEHLLPVRIRPRREQVLAQEHGEEDGLLGHERDRPPQLDEPDVAGVDAAEPGRVPAVGS